MTFLYGIVCWYRLNLNARPFGKGSKALGAEPKMGELKLDLETRRETSATAAWPFRIGQGQIGVVFRTTCCSRTRRLVRTSLCRTRWAASTGRPKGPLGTEHGRIGDGETSQLFNGQQQHIAFRLQARRPDDNRQRLAGQAEKLSKLGAAR
mgnify:CR=1 FL=1